MQDLFTVLKDVQPQRQGLTIDWAQFGALITAIGALGIAAYGVVEALGKALTIVITRERVTVRFGLPYVGFEAVRKMMRPLGPALECAYGAGYLEIVAQQYRADRGSGRAPDTIREGVKLGLPFLKIDQAAGIIGEVWKMDPGHAKALAAALQADVPGQQPGARDAAESDGAQLLAGRFATALDERVNAAFMLADARYEACAKLWAGAAAVALAVIFNFSLSPRFPWWVAAMIGVVAVPLAPVAKDLASSLQNALDAFKAIPAKRR